MGLSTWALYNKSEVSPDGILWCLPILCAPLVLPLYVKDRILGTDREVEFGVRKSGATLWVVIIYLPLVNCCVGFIIFRRWGAQQ